MIHAKIGKEAYRVEITANGHALVSDESAEHGGKGAGAAHAGQRSPLCI